MFLSSSQKVVLHLLLIWADDFWSENKLCVIVFIEE